MHAEAYFENFKCIKRKKQGIKKLTLMINIELKIFYGMSRYVTVGNVRFHSLIFFKNCVITCGLLLVGTIIITTLTALQDAVWIIATMSTSNGALCNYAKTCTCILWIAIFPFHRKVSQKTYSFRFIFFFHHDITMYLRLQPLYDTKLRIL